MNLIAGKRDFVIGGGMQRRSTQAIDRKRFLGIFFGMLGSILACCADAMLPKYSYAYGGNHD